MLHYDGSAWNTDPKLTRPTLWLHAVDIISETDVWAVGNDIVHFDGTLWTVVDDWGARGIDMVSSTDGWVVAGNIRHYDGKRCYKGCRKGYGYGICRSRQNSKAHSE